MRVEVLLFASLREIVGDAKLSLEVPAVITVSDLLRSVEEFCPALRGRLGHVRVAIDREFGAPNDRIPPGAEIALIPPVSGGSAQ